MEHPGESQFGKYQLLDRIAAGGMAEIYRARYTGAAGVTRPVVIKKILPHYAGNKSFISMFINEAKIAAGLSHGNIAQVFDFGEIEGEYFLAMEYVHGQPLSKVLKRAKSVDLHALPAPLAALVAIEVCRGLHYAHTRLDEHGRPLKIIHRDVSSQNVIVSYEGQVKIVDFGIAKARNAGRTETAVGAVKGKYVYFAPEQARGKELDARTDIFATGILLYEMLCGRLPFEGKMVEVMGKIIRGEFPRPREVNPSIPEELERIVLMAMARDKADRFQSAEAFQEALAMFLHRAQPGLSTTTLSLFLMYLFEKELVSEGRPVKLPREFSELLEAWRSGASPLPLSPLPLLSPGEQPGRRRGRRALLLSVPLGAMALAGALVVGVGRHTEFSVQLTSTPPGATVRIDGQTAGAVTPVLITSLSSLEKHTLEVEAEGMQPWTSEVAPAEGVVEIHAELVATTPRPTGNGALDGGSAAATLAPPPPSPAEPSSP